MVEGKGELYKFIAQCWLKVTKNYLRKGASGSYPAAT